ncbi:hypothetical protein LINPERPRIM_LOCUS30036 [Linum perenne]
MWRFLQARQLDRMGLQRRLLPTTHGPSHGFFSVEFYWLTGVETTYRCTSYHLLRTRGLQAPTAGVVRFSHGCIRSWGGRPSLPVVV